VQREETEFSWRSLKTVLIRSLMELVCSFGKSPENFLVYHFSYLLSKSTEHTQHLWLSETFYACNWPSVSAYNVATETPWKFCSDHAAYQEKIPFFYQ